jgi:drug/metabolite transporter (DMT)-like permease
MAAFVAILLALLPFALYLAWRRFGPNAGEPSSGMVIALLLGVGLMLSGAMWFGLSRSFERGSAYVPATLGSDGTVQQGHTAEPRR